MGYDYIEQHRTEITLQTTNEEPVAEEVRKILTHNRYVKQIIVKRNEDDPYKFSIVWLQVERGVTY